MLDCTQLSWAEMADVLRAVRNETRTRTVNTNFQNKPFVNSINNAILDLETLAEAEA